MKAWAIPNNLVAQSVVVPKSEVVHPGCTNIFVDSRNSLGDPNTAPQCEQRRVVELRVSSPQCRTAVAGCTAVPAQVQVPRSVLQLAAIALEPRAVFSSEQDGTKVRPP